MSYRQRLIRREVVVRCFPICSVLLAFAFLATSHAVAALLDWDGDQSFDGSFDGEFGVAKNWNPDLSPAAGHMVNFNAAANYTVTLTADGAADELRVVAGHAMLLSNSDMVRTFNVVSGNMDGNVSGGELTIGSADNPVVVNVGDIMNIGSNASGTNTVTVSGDRSELNAAAATTHSVGRNGRTGQLFLTDRGIASYGGTLRIGVDNNSVGLVRAEFGGILFADNIEVATVGTGGSGTLQVTNGGSSISQNVAGATLTIGSAAGKAGTVDVRSGGTFTTGTGATTINATGTVSVGVTGDGTFDVEGDVNLVGGTINVGSDAGDVFSLGSGQTLTASAGGTIEFGGTYEIAGTFDIQNATFDVDGPLTVAATGILTLDGGTVNAKAGFDASSGSFVHLDGTLSVTDGAFVPSFDPFGNLYVYGFTADADPHLVLGTGATTNVSESLSVGFFNGGNLTVTDGAQVTSSSGSIGVNPESTGMVYVSGTDTVGNPSVWEVDEQLEVGAAGVGVLNIDGGARVFSDLAYIGWLEGGDGTVAVSGTDDAGHPSSWSNSSDLNVGFIGAGSLSIEGGAQVSSDGGLVGVFSGVEGSVVVQGTSENGTPSQWNNSDFLLIGNVGSGILTISDGGVVTNVNGFIGTESGSDGQVTVAGDGSKWINTGNLLIASGEVGGESPSDGSLTIVDGGLVEVAGTLTIYEPGIVTLDGGILKVDSTLVVNDGTMDFVTGTFHLTDVGGYTVGANSGPIDQVLGYDHITIPNGGGLIVDEVLIVPSSTSISVSAGAVAADEIINNELVIAADSTLSTTSGFTNNADLVLVGSTVEGPVDNFGGSTVTVLGTVEFNGLVSGSADFFGPGTANFNGGLAPGASPAEVSFEGNLSLADTNTLFIEIGGLASGSQYDRLVVDGDALIDGILDVSLVDDFEPTPGQQFTILTASSLVDNGLMLGGTGASSFDLLVDSSSVTLLAVTGLAGDYNQNGAVDAADYTLWRNNFGSDTSLPNDDTPGVGQDDYARWKTHFGETAGSGSARHVGSSTGDSPSLASVPEPATATLLITLLTVLAIRLRGNYR